MDSFIDIRIKPDDEMRENALLNKVYSKLHKALFDLQSHDIGISFPETKVMLGKLIRVHATQQRLEALIALPWLGGLSGYCNCSAIQKVPKHVQHRVVSRWRPNMSQAHLRRLIKRGSVSENEIKVYREKMLASQKTPWPYLELKSTSTGKQHRRYIQTSALQNDAVVGHFDHFGLSKTATVPWF